MMTLGSSIGSADFEIDALLLSTKVDAAVDILTYISSYYAEI